MAEHAQHKKRARFPEDLDQLTEILGAIVQQQKFLTNNIGSIETPSLHSNQTSSSPPRSDGLPSTENDKPQDLMAGKHKFYSKIADELFTEAKKQYTTIWDLNYSAREGLQKLKKHFEENTIPTALNMKYFRITTSSINYSTLFDPVKDYDLDKEDAVKNYMKIRNEECQADLLAYQRALIQRCIADKDYHLQQTDAILEAYDVKIQQKWASELSVTHGEVQVREICLHTIQEFRNWKLDFHYHRHKSTQSAALKKTRTAAKKAAAEQLLQDKYSKFTPVQMVQEALRLSRQHASKPTRQLKTAVPKSTGKGTSTKKPVTKPGTGAQRNTSARSQSRTQHVKKTIPHQGNGKGTGAKRNTSASTTQTRKAKGKKNGHDTGRASGRQ